MPEEEELFHSEETGDHNGHALIEFLVHGVLLSSVAVGGDR